MRGRATDIRRVAIAVAVVLVVGLVGGRPADASETAPIVVRYTLSPAGHDAISVTTDAGLTIARRVLQGAVVAAGVADRANAGVVISDRNNGAVLQATVDGRLATRHGDHLRLAVSPSALGAIADDVGRDVVIELCLPEYVSADLTNLIVVRDATVLNCFNGGEAAVFTLAPGASRPGSVGVVLRPSLARATAVWLGLWVAAGLFTLVFWGVARLLRRWLLPKRPVAARWIGGSVGVLVAAFGSFVSWAIGGFGGPAFNVAYLRPEGTGALVALMLASTVPGAIAGIVFLRTLVPRFAPQPAVQWAFGAPLPPPYYYGSPAPPAPPTGTGAGFPSSWDPPTPQPAAPPAPVALPPWPTWMPPPPPPPPPPRDVLPPESKGRLALLLGLFGGAVPLLGGVAALFASRAAQEQAPRRSQAARVLGIVQLCAWPVLALLCLL